jgi:hypothetical protein
MDHELRAQLLARQVEDQRVRRLARPPAGHKSARIPDDLARAWRRVDEGNTAWLADLVTEHGRPGRTVAGDDGAHAAWLLAQHADHRPDQQRLFLEALRAAVADGEASVADLANLEDRVRVNAGQPQIYGTQFTGVGEGFGPAPIDDPDNLDQRRAAVGLESFADYRSRMTM